ncbi:MAG: hypothetical protein WCF28_01840 [Methanobacterium sp.]|uniref:hypothetical protein n=1 Tax=Methanobacterium sp. TaxID=2164 RepID=UPI003C72EE0F
MSETPIIKIKSEPEIIRIIAKRKGDVSIETINLRIIMANLWWEGSPELETFFNVMELKIKKALNEVYPHDKMSIDYNYSADDALEDASKILVEITDIKADGVDIDIGGRFITLDGTDSRGFFKKMTSFRRKFTKEICKEI